METDTDYITTTHSTLLDCAVSNEEARARGQPINCRIDHSDMFYDGLRITRKTGGAPLHGIFICPRCGANVRDNKTWADELEYAEYFDQIEDNMKKIREAIDTRYAKKHAGHYLGAREFTLTYSPKWFTDDEARVKMRLAIEKITRVYKSQIVELRAVGEVGKEGLSHIHCYYLLDRGLKITEKEFKRAYPVWDSKVVLSRTGHKGGHHADVKDEAHFKSYIDKEIDNAWLDIHIDNREI